MSYISQREKVFGCGDSRYSECSPPKIKRSDHRLKRFYSTSDKRAWNVCDTIRHQYFYETVSGSQTCLNIDQCHQYVPLEDLIAILTADKDEYIKDLEAQLKQCCKGSEDDRLKGSELNESNELSSLRQELNSSREMLRRAMHKLQNIDEIVNENKRLHCRLRCSEERIKSLEEKKKRLECELADLRSKSQIQMDLQTAQQRLKQVCQRREDSTEMDEETLQNWVSERDDLQKKMKQLEKELEESKKKEVEIEILKKQSQSDTLSIEEMSKENECYRKKLSSMKCLEKQIQDLKKQGRALADKYKRESEKASEQLKKMSQATKELQALREERDLLRERVNELACYENQFNALQRKLQCVDTIIAENEKLNSKLTALSKMEEENEYLRCKLEELKEMEMSAIVDKERIRELQYAVADQEEEMKDLLCQIEMLTNGRTEEELERLKCELYEKNSKLKLCEEQLAEIPMLEAEIDELRTKLQCCNKEFSETKKGEYKYQKIEVRLPTKSNGVSAMYKNQCSKSSLSLGVSSEEKVDLNKSCSSYRQILQNELEVSKSPDPCEKKQIMSCEDVQNLLQSSKGIISCVLEDMIEHQKDMEELEHCNKTMKCEIENLKAQIGSSDKDKLLEEISCLKKCLEEKDLEISKLKEISNSASKENELNEEELKELNQELKAQLEAACTGLKQIADLEKLLELERQARCEAERLLKEAKTNEYTQPLVTKTSEEDQDFDCCKSFVKEIDDLKLQILELNKLTEELKKENELLREIQQPCPDFSKELDEKCALENLLSLLQAELDACKSQKLSDECEALRNELKRVMEQNCQLKALVDCYRQRLDLEKKSNELEQTRGETFYTEPAKRKSERDEGIETDKEPEKIVKDEELSVDLEVPEKKRVKEEEPAKAPEPPVEQKKEDDKLLEEINRLKRLLEERDEQRRQCEEKLKARDAEIQRMQETIVKDPVPAPKPAPEPAPKPAPEPAPKPAPAPEPAPKPAPAPEPAPKPAPAPESAPKPAPEPAPIPAPEPAPKPALEPAPKPAPEPASKPKVAVDNDLEDCQKKLRQMEAENAEKLKKLMEQHEKELSNRDKIYNDNLNAMKSGYETDIRKMAERHKASIMRLQNLHEDEVQEMNTNYETQMENMQTQTEEAMKDLARDSDIKIKKLSQQHDNEIKAMEAKLIEKLEEKKAKDDLDGSISRLKSKHSREMQKLIRSSMIRMSVEKNKYEGLLEEQKKKSSVQLETFKKKLREQEMGDGICQCKSIKKKPRKPRDPTCPLDFNEILEKILEQGIESLTFNEIALVHRKTCCALEGIVMNSKVTSMLEPPVGDVCPHSPLLQADKDQLLNRIFTLENEIKLKQRQTQEAIINMEVAIKKEKCRLQELKNLLENEQQKNSQLKSLLTNSSKLQNNLKMERDKLGNQISLHQSLFKEKNKQLDEEKKSKRNMEEELEKLRLKVNQLYTTLDMERENSKSMQRKESDHVQTLKSKLEQSLNHERKLALQLENEAKYRIQLQCQLQALGQSFKHMVHLPAVGKDIPNPLEAKSAKEKQNLDQIKEKKSKIKSRSGKKQKK